MRCIFLTRKEKENLIKIAVTAICIGFVAISKFFSFTLPLFGASGMNVGFGGIFTAFPAFLFGPVFGGVASAASDLLGVIIKPTGPYNPIFTITAFCGGFIKGWIWRLLAARNDGRIRRVALCLLLLLGIVGGAFHIALVSDGVTSGLVSEQAELPTRGAIRAEDYNPLTKLVVHLADYNNDVITYSRYTGEADTVTLPSAIVYPDGYTLKVTKLGAKAFPEAVLRVQIPESVTTIDEKAFDGLAEGSVIVGAAGSAAQKAAEKAGIAFEEAEVDAQTVEVDAAGVSADGAFKNSDTFRKYLAGYINFITLGPEGTALLGLLYIGAEALINLRRRKRGKEGGAPHIRIFASIFGSGLIVTTINTVVLRYFTLPAWAGRAFWILWTPRALEELIVCIIQAYFIAILYDVYMTRFQDRL